MGGGEIVDDGDLGGWVGGGIGEFCEFGAEDEFVDLVGVGAEVEDVHLFLVIEEAGW